MLEFAAGVGSNTDIDAAVPSQLSSMETSTAQTAPPVSSQARQSGVSARSQAAS
jgi:hypothetical protein